MMFMWLLFLHVDLLIALLHILCYVHGTIFQNLLISFDSNLALQAFVEADCASDVSNCKSIIGFCIFLGDFAGPLLRLNIVLWLMLQQRLFGFIGFLDLGVSLSSPTLLYCDNQSAI